MTVNEFIEKLSAFDGDIKIGGCGHFGEILEIWDLYISNYQGEKFVAISIEDAGEEPD